MALELLLQTNDASLRWRKMKNSSTADFTKQSLFSASQAAQIHTQRDTLHGWHAPEPSKSENRPQPARAHSSNANVTRSKHKLFRQFWALGQLAATFAEKKKKIIIIKKNKRTPKAREVACSVWLFLLALSRLNTAQQNHLAPSLVEGSKGICRGSPFPFYVFGFKAALRH